MREGEWAGDERQTMKMVMLLVGGQWWTACVTGIDKK